MNRELVGKTAARFLDDLEEDFPADAEIVQTAVVAELRVPDEDGGTRGTVFYRCSTDRWVEQVGLFRAALHLAASDT